MNRREFIEMTALTGAAAVLEGCKCPLCGCGGSVCDRVPYGDTIGDRLWMWGHHRDSFKALKGRPEQYNLPYETRIDMAAACREMNIPGCFMVRWTNNPKKDELPEYMKQFKDTKRVGFSITDSAVETFDEKLRLGLEYADKMPNLTTLIMDDYFQTKDNSRPLSELRSMKEKLIQRNLKLGIVLYADDNGVKLEYKELLDFVDEVTFWFWHGKNVTTIESQVDKLRKLIGDEKPVLLGQYMWDFGGRKPMPGQLMENQLAQTTRLLKTKAVNGVIFHCTPLVDMDLDSVKVSRAWIKENASKKWGA